MGATAWRVTCLFHCPSSPERVVRDGTIVEGTHVFAVNIGIHARSAVGVPEYRIRGGREGMRAEGSTISHF